MPVMKKYIDAHCHIHLVENSAEILKEMMKKSIVGGICNAVTVSDWKKIAELCIQNESIRGTLGVHPLYINDVPSDFMRLLLEQLTIYPEFGVGECGLDSRGDIEKQTKIFEMQLKAGYLMKRPVHIHCVHAFDKLLRILKENRSKLPPVMLLHGYSGNEEITKRLTGYDVYFSVSARFFKGRNKAEVLKYIPLDRLLIESDAPDDLKMPAELPNILVLLEQEMKIPQEDLAQIIYQNTERFLSWKNSL